MCEQSHRWWRQGVGLWVLQQLPRLLGSLLWEPLPVWWVAESKAHFYDGPLEFAQPRCTEICSTVRILPPRDPIAYSLSLQDMSGHDLCEECYKSPTVNQGTCTHSLRPLSMELESNQHGGVDGRSGLTEEQRKERQRSIQWYIQLIEHVSRCNSLHCSSSNCAKMESYLQHGRRICKVSCLLFYFAHRVFLFYLRDILLLLLFGLRSRPVAVAWYVKRFGRCCAFTLRIARIRIAKFLSAWPFEKRIRQLAKQQQAKDDRHHQEMNRHYRMGMVENQQ